MDATSQLDGSDATPGASTQAQLVSALKEHLRSALLILDAFDRSSFSNLSTDKKYKDSVQRLLSPLTTLSLSSVVDQANQVLRSGLDAISARMSAIVDSPHPSTIAQGPLLPQSSNTFAVSIPTPIPFPPPKPNLTPKPQRAPRPPPVAPPLPLTVTDPQLSPLATLQNKAQDMTVSIHFLAGSCRPDANMQTLVYSINANIRLRAMQRSQSSSAAPLPANVVAEARKSRSGNRVVLGVNPGTFKMDDLVNFMMQEFNLSAFCNPGSVTRVRRGGTVEYAVRIKNVPRKKRGNSISAAQLVRETEAYLSMTWGQAIKLTTSISPLIYRCEGPKVALDRFCAAPAGSFDLLVEYGPGSQRLFPGVTVEGLCLYDAFDFI